MNTTLKHITFTSCLFISATLFGQVKGNKNRVNKNVKVFHRAVLKTVTALPNRKIMLRSDNLVWVYPTGTSKGRWERAKVQDKEGLADLKKHGDTLYQVTFKDYNIYSEAARHSATIPKKAFEINKFEEHPEWITENGTEVKSSGSRLQMKGALGKTNVYYHKNINLLTMNFAGYNKYEYPETNIANTDHIIVTDTLRMPPECLGFINIQRRNRGYIKIIANCIIYERPVKISSTLISNKTDFVFSADKFFLKSPYKDLTNTQLKSSLPFIWKVDTNVEAYVDPFNKNEKLLMNRLMITFLVQIAAQLQDPNLDSWAKDALLVEFQRYRSRVNIVDSVNDSAYLNVFQELGDNFVTKYGNGKINSHRSVNGLDILVEGKVVDLPKTPFKYYAIPTMANLIPVNNNDTGYPDKLGFINFNAEDSKLSLTLETELTYNSDLFKISVEELNKKGLKLESKPPKEVLFIDEQPLKVLGKTIGKIIPISNRLLRLEIDLPDDGMSLLKFFPPSNDLVFNLNFKTHDTQKTFKQELSLKVPEGLLKESDFGHLIKKFNIVEINKLTDHVTVTSHLEPIKPEGVFNYCKIWLEFQFDDKKVFVGPNSFSAEDTLASNLIIPFMKYSENYSIKVSGTAFYEDGQRDIKENTIIKGQFVILEESMFEDNSLKN